MSYMMPVQHPPTPPMQDHMHRRSHSEYGDEFLDQPPYLQQTLSTQSAPFEHPKPATVHLDGYKNAYGSGARSQGPWRQFDPINNGTVEPYPHAGSNLRGRLPTPESPDTVDQAARNKRFPGGQTSPTKAKAKKEKPTSDIPRLTKPLSELAEEFKHIPIKNTEAWVRRSTEERQRETRADGFVKRPPNSFILYRSAFADLCREYEKSNNHQDISSIAGASWKLEKPHIKEQFRHSAKIERENHQIAFPDYKFQPQQDIKSKKRRSGDSPEESADDLLYRGAPLTPGSAPLTGSSSGSSKKKRVSHLGLSTRSPTHSNTSDESWAPHDPYLPLSPSRSQFGHGQPGKPLPSPGMYSRLPSMLSYHQSAPASTSHPGARYPQMSDGPASAYNTSPPVGLPGATHGDLLGPSSEMGGGHLMLTPSAGEPDMLGYEHHEMPFTGYHAGEYLHHVPGDYNTSYRD